MHRDHKKMYGFSPSLRISNQSNAYRRLKEQKTYAHLIVKDHDWEQYQQNLQLEE